MALVDMRGHWSGSSEGSIDCKKPMIVCVKLVVGGIALPQRTFKKKKDTHVMHFGTKYNRKIKFCFDVRF